MAMDDFYQQMIISRMERQEIEDADREHLWFERENWLMMYDIKKRE
jgi:hypothetical protein